MVHWDVAILTDTEVQHMFEGATAKELGLNKVTAPDDKGVMRDWWAVSLAGMSDGQVASCRKLTSYYRACVLRDSFWLQPQQQLSKEQGERTFEWQKQIHLQQERVVSDRTTLKSYAECMAKVRLEEAQHAAEEAAAEEAAEEQDKEEEDPDGYGAKTVRPKKDIVEDPTLEAEEAAGARGHASLSQRPDEKQKPRLRLRRTRMISKICLAGIPVTRKWRTWQKHTAASLADRHTARSEASKSFCSCEERGWARLSQESRPQFCYRDVRPLSQACEDLESWCP